MAKQQKGSTKKHKVTGSRRQMVHRSQPATRSAKAKEAPRRPAVWWYVGGGVVLAAIAGVVLWFTIGPGASGTPSSPAMRADMYSAPPAMQIDTAKAYVATITTARGAIVVDLDANAAPQTVNNFVFLSREGFYDGLTFHRVESGFVIQGGDPSGTGSGGPGYTVPSEINLTHGEGAIAMARLPDEVNPERASSGSQFYITLAPTPFLDGAYTVFGQVTDGMDVVKSIQVGDAIETIVIEER